MGADLTVLKVFHEKLIQIVDDICYKDIELQHFHTVHNKLTLF